MHNYLDSFFSDLSEVSAKSRQSLPGVSYPALPFSFNFLYQDRIATVTEYAFYYGMKGLYGDKKLPLYSISSFFLSTSLIWQLCYSTLAHLPHYHNLLIDECSPIRHETFGSISVVKKILAVENKSNKSMLVWLGDCRL